MSKKKRNTKKAEEKFFEDIEYENFFDAWAINFKKGVFFILCGQSDKTPAKMVARLWTDVWALKELSDFLQEQIKMYEKKYGKIE